MTRLQALADILLALALTLLAGIGAQAVGMLLIGGLGWPLLPALAAQGLLIVAGLQALLWARGQTWRQLRLLAPTGHDLPRAVLALALLLTVNAVFHTLLTELLPNVVAAHQRKLEGLAAMLSGGLSGVSVAAVMLFVGFYEEALARGFLLTRCQSLAAGTAAPVLLSSLLFGLGHFYQGWLGVAQTTIAGLLLASLTVRWGTLWPAILAHAALNTVSLLILT